MATVESPATAQSNAPQSNEERPVTNPRTGEVLYTIREATDEQCNQAFQNARAAYETIRRMSVKERLKEVSKLRRYIRDNKEMIVDRVIAETGKSRMDAMLTEVFSVLDLIFWYERTAEKDLADVIMKTPLLLAGKKARIYYEPIGPVLVISPWNYPFNTMMGPVLGAFLAGNPVVVKPSEWTPLLGLVEKMVAESGFFKDAIQVVYGSGITGGKLIDQRPAKIHFTGSTRTGKRIMKQASDYLIPVELELGGKDPMIVFDDVDINRTVNGALWGGFTNSGQTCTAVERIYVQDSIYDDFVQQITEKAKKLTNPGNFSGEDDGSMDIGCMTAPFQLDIVEKHLADAKEKGATLSTDGTRIPGTHVIPPTVVTNITDDMLIAREETFGPIVTVVPFKDEDEAIRMANDSQYGLSASVWSRDTERGTRVARAIHTGNVSINNVLATQGHSGLPFGGMKESGFGRYKGAHGLHSFSNIKSIIIDRQGGKLEANWYPYTKEKYALFTKLIDYAFHDSQLKMLWAAVVGLKLESLIKKTKL